MTKRQTPGQRKERRRLSEACAVGSLAVAEGLWCATCGKPARVLPASRSFEEELACPAGCHVGAEGIWGRIGEYTSDEGMARSLRGEGFHPYGWVGRLERRGNTSMTPHLLSFHRFLECL